jgi:LEA14-like dessication related protein
MEVYMVRRFHPAVGLALAILVVAGGCAGLGKRLETPRISLSSIKVQESSGFETVFQVQLRVLNPNDVDLEVNGVDCELEVNSHPFASGISSTRVRIPAYGAEVVPLTAYTSVVNIFRSIVGLHKASELGYRLKGKLRLGGEAWLPPLLPFESTGTFDFGEFAGMRK